MVKGNNNNVYLKYIKKIFLGGLIFCAVLIIAFAITAYFSQDKIKNYIIKELNKQLTAQLYVDKTDFSVFKRFPYVSVVFNNITLKEAIPDKNKGDLLKAENLYLQFNLLDFLRGNYKIIKIELDNASAKLIVYKDKTDNFHFWKNNNIKEKNNFAFYLQKVLLKNSDVTYNNYSTSQDFSVKFHNVSLNGRFASDKYVLTTEGKCFINNIKSGDILYIYNKPAEFNVNMDVNNTTGIFKFRKAKLKLADLNFNITGNIVSKTNEQNIDMEIKGKRINLNYFIKEIPANYRTFFNNYEANGVFNIICNIKGNINNDLPEIVVTANLVNGKLIQKSTDITLNNLNLDFIYNNGRKTASKLDFIECSNITGTLKNSNFSGNITLNNLNRPDIVINLKTLLELKDLNDFFKIDTIENMSGTVDGNIFFHGQTNEKGKFTTHDFIQSKFKGNINISNCNVNFKNSRQTYSGINGHLIINNNNVEVNSLEGNIIVQESYNKSTVNNFKLNGHLYNLLPYIFIKNEKISIDAKLVSDKIEMDKLLLAANNQHKKSSNVYFFQLPDNINLNLNTDINNFIFAKFKANKLSGKIILNNQQINATQIRFNTMDGYVMASGIIDGTRDGKILLNCDLTLNNIDIQKLFYQFNNFGQESINYDNIKGKVTADVQFAASANNALHIDINSIYVKSSIKIDNGELVNYKPVEGLSPYLKGRDLSRIKFSTLTNQIEIQDKTVYIPSMEVKSSALNMSISGKHTFDNEIEYHLCVLLSDLKNPDKIKKEEFGPVEEDELNKGYYFFMITGTIDNPKYHKIDKQAYKEKITNNIKKEKENLKEILQKEFGRNKKDSIGHKNINKTAKEKEEFRKKEGSGFIYEWEEK